MMDTLQWLYVGLNAVMSIIPYVNPLVFAYLLAGGWLGLGACLVVYINLLGGNDRRVLRIFLNVFWIYMLAATVGFVLTRQSPLHALGWFIVCTIAFEVMFINAMAIRDRWEKEERYSWRWWLALLIGAPLFIVGFPFDVQYNLTWGRLMFLQKPRLMGAIGTPWRLVFGGDWTLTANLKRNVLNFTWQGVVARFVCRWLVEPWDKGHCGKLPA